MDSVHGVPPITTTERLQVKTDDLGRQVWDKNFFSRKALLRQYEGEDPGMDFMTEELGISTKKKRKDVPPPIERRPLEQRSAPVPLESELGKSKIITALTPKQQQGGFWCDVCECLVKDSQAYLDHINGKKHNRQLGMNMTVERVDVDVVKNKLQQAKLERLKQQNIVSGSDLYGGVESRLLETAEKDKKKKKNKKKKKKQKQEDEKEGTINSSLNILFPGCNIRTDDDFNYQLETPSITQLGSEPISDLETSDIPSSKRIKI